jgi:hypothetical protein
VGEDLGANCAGAVPCDLGANDDGTKLRVYFLKAFFRGTFERIFRKKLKTKKTVDLTRQHQTKDDGVTSSDVEHKRST